MILSLNQLEIDWSRLERVEARLVHFQSTYHLLIDHLDDHNRNVKHNLEMRRSDFKHENRQAKELQAFIKGFVPEHMDVFH